MSADWREYQERVADCFRRLGLEVKVDHQEDGARARHAIDVYVHGQFHGIQFKWIVECKAWKSAVPKEKVMALAAIVQDTGADRGFLFSEAGFQSGAVRACNKTNITLFSLEEISNELDAALTDAAIASLHWRLQKAVNRLREIKRTLYDDEYYPPVMKPLGELLVVESALNDGLKNDFPTVYRVDQDVRHSANSLDELLKVANEMISDAESWSPPE